MAASDADVLSQVGLDFIMKGARIAFEGVCYGIYLVLIYLFAFIVLRRISFKSPKSVYLVIVTIILFSGCSIFYALDIADIILRFKIIIMDSDDPSLSFQDKLDKVDNLTKPLVWTGEMLFILMLTLGDSVVVWRTWALYQDNRKFLIIPLCTWTGSVIAAFYELGCDIHTNWAIVDLDPSAASVGEKSCARADTASYSMSFGTNFLCTCLIIYRAWEHRKFMSEHLGRPRKKTHGEKVLTLLVESGSVYLILYTLQAIPIYGGTTPSSFIPWEVVNAIIQQGMGMYPTAIIVLVQMHKSLWDEPYMGFTPTGGGNGAHRRGGANTAQSGIEFRGLGSLSTGEATTAAGSDRCDDHLQFSGDATTRLSEKLEDLIRENVEREEGRMA